MASGCIDSPTNIPTSSEPLDSDATKNIIYDSSGMIRSSISRVRIGYVKETDCICHIYDTAHGGGGISCIPYEQLDVPESSPFFRIKYT
jgi:hypothetical protein